MAKRKSKSEHKPNVSCTEVKHSTCSEIHLKCAHENAGCIKTDPYNALYFCPESREVPNPMHGTEFQIHIKTCIFCYHRLTRNFIIKSNEFYLFLLINFP